MFPKCSPLTYSLNKSLDYSRLIFIYGWGTWIRTKEMGDSESPALPLGDTPIIGLYYKFINLLILYKLFSYNLSGGKTNEGNSKIF